MRYGRGFRALADPTRRALLDELFHSDGQTLSALEARFRISRFAVMKHLRTLEVAGLVVTRRRGREKLHYLNPVPIRLVHDRWVIEPVGDSCRLSVTHDELGEGADEQLYGGWPMILSGLKTWLETGELLTTPGSLMYSGR
ncbi:helix-turn-helix domain-containing protein [Streptomyces sp. NPDC005899]|uniref:ArsR/SmtB family transcription factor n=1 Tax=Streptomyces sp. NPDC005899 TaxID=3155716 RepID=UPI0033D4464E